MLRAVLALLLPSTLLAVLCVVGAALLGVGHRRRRARRVGMALLGAGGAGLAVVLLLPVDLWLLRPLENRFPIPQRPPHSMGWSCLAVRSRLRSVRTEVYRPLIVTLTA